MIVVDVETGGIDPQENPLLSIGAKDFDTNEKFTVNIEPILGSIITKEASDINGYDPNTWVGEPLKKAIKSFDKWLQGRDLVLAGHNPSFDLSFLQANFKRVGLKCPFGYRTVDLHSIAYLVLEESLKSDEIYQALCMPEEPRPHIALNGAIWEWRAFKRLFEMASH